MNYHVASHEVVLGCFRYRTQLISVNIPLACIILLRNRSASVTYVMGWFARIYWFFGRLGGQNLRTFRKNHPLSWKIRKSARFPQHEMPSICAWLYRESKLILSKRLLIEACKACSSTVLGVANGEGRPLPSQEAALLSAAPTFHSWAFHKKFCQLWMVGEGSRSDHNDTAGRSIWICIYGILVYSMYNTYTIIYAWK